MKRMSVRTKTVESIKTGDICVPLLCMDLPVTNTVILLQSKTSGIQERILLFFPLVSWYLEFTTILPLYLQPHTLHSWPE